MQITLHLPDAIAVRFGTKDEIPRHLLELLAADGYRAGQLSRQEVADLLGLDYWETDRFLGEYEATRPYTLKDLEADRLAWANGQQP